MTNLLRMAALVALTGLWLPSAITTPAQARAIHCSAAKHCPAGDRCSIKPHHKSGVCIAISKSQTQFCDQDEDCKTGFCKRRPGHKDGVCVSPHP
jgi:hypothetical protein